MLSLNMEGGMEADMQYAALWLVGRFVAVDRQNS